MPINVNGQITGIVRSTDKQVMVNTGSGYSSAADLGINPLSVFVPTRYTANGVQQVLTERGYMSINATLGDVVSGVTQLPANQPFAGYVAMIPGNQAVNSGSAKSVAGNVLAEAYPSALTGRGTLTDAEMWSNPGYITTLNKVGGHFEIPLVAFAPNLAAGQGILVAFKITAAAPAATTGIVAQSNGAANTQGFALRVIAGSLSKITPSYNTAAGSFAVTTGIAAVLDNTEHTAMFFIHPSGYCALFVDGEIDRIYSIISTQAIGASVPTAPLTFGADSTVGNSDKTAMAAKFRHIHVIAFDTLPLNLGQIAKRLASEDARTHLRNSDVVLASKAVGLYYIAQSNCAGSGNTPGTVGPMGIPDRDAIAAGTAGETRSIKSGLAKRLAARGVAALWGNSAVGGTALTDSWCGRIRNWVTNSNVLRGSYMLSGGTVWKCDNPVGAGGASTVAPAAGTGADGIMWVSLGAPTAEDLSVLAGVGVYPNTSARWDPNGHHADGNSRAAMMASTCSDVVAMLSIGQGDRTVGASRAAYSYSIQQSAAWHLARNATKFTVNMTVRSNAGTNWSASNGGGTANADNDTSDHWYDRQLMPGRLDALAALSSNPKVFAGWDWATGIGPVTVRSSPTEIGVKSDGLHMTDATYESLAVPLADAALLACGI